MQELKQNLIPIYNDPIPVKFADEQLKVFWMHNEPKLEKDIQSVLVDFTEAEKHAVITTLKLFSLYEMHAGDEYWGGRFKKIFKEPEFRRMASVFSMFELAVHGPFYNRINELLNINTPEFYLSYSKTESLKQRMQHIDSMINHPNDAVSVASFSLVEGVILYSNFAYLKHYQANGKNKILNTIRGIDFSLRDENLHSLGGAYAFKYLCEKHNYSSAQIEAIKCDVEQVAKQIYLHEKEIIALMFEKGDVKGITAVQLDNFVQSRINECLKQLGFNKIYEVKYNPIADWFYDSINKYSFVDFFTGVSKEYHRDWDEEGFSWNEE